MSQLAEIIGQTYKVIKGYIPREEAISISNRFRVDAIADKYENTSDGFVNDAVNKIDYPELCALQFEKVTYLNELLGAKVLPTYNYTRIYTEGSVLPRHFDRDPCEVSLTIHLDGDKEWAFAIVDADGNDIEVVLEPGDAILYDGPNADHWRDAYSGEYYVQSFHHYVFLGGKNEIHMYNQQARDGAKLENFIKVYEGLVPKEICTYIIKTISEQYSTRWSPAEIIGDADDHRVCEILTLTASDPVDTTVHKYVTRAIDEYVMTFPDFNVSEDSGYSCLRYFPGGKYDYHTDQHQKYNREVTIIINLNNDYEGGELCHFRDGTQRSLSTGDVCIFPSNFAYPHSIAPIKTGVRYSIVTWAV